MSQPVEDLVDQIDQGMKIHCIKYAAKDKEDMLHHAWNLHGKHKETEEDRDSFENELALLKESALDQRKEIGDLQKLVDQLETEKQKHVIEKQDLVIKSNDLQLKIDEMASINQAAKDKEGILQGKLKATEEYRDHLKDQLANSEDFLNETLIEGSF